MLDPSLPWVSHGYKKLKDDFSQKFLSDVDYTKHSTDTSSENRLRISTPIREQQERVKSATVRRVQDGRSGSARSRDSGGDTYLFLRESRPRSAYSTYSVKSFMSGPPQVKNKRARSATVRRKAADLQKSFTQIERSYEEERLNKNFRKLARPRTAQGLVRGRPNVTWSGDWRPTSSTGLIPTTPFDRYVSYERPRSARRV
ncbi:hypothetical protein Bbelb_170930 [Branchiostoma belcheri]|nr:hypothetical protein Bbelb_170930 [Branchiostoma belcheri]